MNSITNYVRVLLVFISILVCCCACTTNGEKVIESLVVTDQSYFDDVYVNGDYIEYHCCYTIANHESTDVQFVVLGDFTSEYKAGMIDETSLIGADAAGSMVFTVAGNAEVSLDIVFTCPIKNKQSDLLKTDRTLPEVTLQKTFF